MKRTTASILTLVLSLTMTASTCSKSNLLSNASDVLSSLQSAQPLINQLIPRATPRISQAISIATKLRDAVARSDSITGVTLLTDLVPTFSQIVNVDINSLTASQKTTILAALAVADIGLHFLVRNLKVAQPITAAASAKTSALDVFDKEEVWGTKYKSKN